ncbi:MAG TPA: hypothetical protein VH044_07250 [Polyangiaceae bacterium]|nr:hypothetical protein [Polyangiaceae bacterium]
MAVSAACSSSSDNNNNNNNPVPEIDAGITPVVDAAAIEDAVAQHEAAPAAATFTQVYTDIISPICVQCHNPNGIGVSLGHLDMSTKAVAFMDLVGVSAMGSACGGMGTRVVAGNANSSILFKKVDPAQASPCGSKMPLGLTPLTEAQTAEIEGWINAGAMNN